jgi:hypothetical protein
MSVVGRHHALIIFPLPGSCFSMEYFPNLASPDRLTEKPDQNIISRQI